MASSSSQKLESTPVSFYGLALRLRRGASEIVSWSCDRGSLEGVMSVGSDPSCDWTVRGPGIAPFELSLQAPDGRLQVKSRRPGLGAKLDENVLGDDWVTLEPGSRIEFGFACIALEFDAAPLTGVVAHEHEVPLAFLGTPLPPPDLTPPPAMPTVVSQVETARPPASTTKTPAKPTAKTSSAARMDTPRELGSGNSAIITQHFVFESFLRSIETRAEQARDWALKLGEQARASIVPLRSRASDTFAKAQTTISRLVQQLRERPQARAKKAKEPRALLSRRAKVGIYVVLGLLTLFAYTTWLTWLDRM